MEIHQGKQGSIGKKFLLNAATAVIGYGIADFFFSDSPTLFSNDSVVLDPNANISNDIPTAETPTETPTETPAETPADSTTDLVPQTGEDARQSLFKKWLR